MTLPLSGPISLYQIADEFAVPRSTPFPSGFYGKGGAPSSGALTFSNFYGRSNFSLSADTTSINAIGYNSAQVATITSTIATTFSFSGGSARTNTAQPDSTHATVRVSAPASGNGSSSGTVRVTASNGDFIDIFFDAEWGSS